MKRISGAVALALALLGALLHPAAQADPSFPYGDRTTASIADKLNARNRGGWLATTLDFEPGCPTYSGPRRAAIGSIPAGHGRRWVGIIHVTTTDRARAVRRNLNCQGVRYAMAPGGRFVLPLRSSTDTEGGAAESFRVAAAWAVRRLGTGWVVR